MGHHPHHEHTAPVHEHVDEWHHHTSEEGTPQSEHGAETNAAALAAVFVAMVLTLVVVVGLTVVYFDRTITNLRRERIETTALATEANEYKARSQGVLREFGWADAQAGRVHIPIDRAMDRVALRYAERKPGG